MNIICGICCDLFLPTTEVYITKCGHLFHLECFLKWIERSETCPQCRHSCTGKSIHRVYFNLANTDGATEDVGTLISKVESMQFQITLKEKDVKIYKEKYENGKHQNRTLRKEIAELESKHKLHESTIHALKDQISFFKTKSRETDKLSEEVVRLKTNIKNMENVQMAINGTREQVNEMLRHQNDTESLAILAATLKKSLLDAERKKHDMEYTLKKVQNELTRYRRETNTLECQNKDLRKELQFVKDNLEKEKQYLKNKISELNKKISQDNLDITNTSLKRIIAESPVNFSRKPKLSLPEEFLNETASPTLEEQVKQIVDSDSPYLSVKPTSAAMSILNSKSKLGPKNGYTIFKSTAKSMNDGLLGKPKNDVVYNGLGGSSKDEVYPTPKPTKTGIKRPKSCSAVSSQKFKKLAPVPSGSKVTNYFSQDNSQ